MSFVCRGCGALVWNPKDGTEHKSGCPNIKRLEELAVALSDRAKQSLETLEKQAG